MTSKQEKTLQGKKKKQKTNNKLLSTEVPLFGFMITVQPGLNVLRPSSISLFPDVVDPEIADIRPMTGSST